MGAIMTGKDRYGESQGWGAVVGEKVPWGSDVSVMVKDVLGLELRRGRFRV